MIDRKVREAHIPRHLAAIALAAEHGISISRYARDEDLATIRGATSGRLPAPGVVQPAPPRREERGVARAKRTRKPGRTVFVVYGRNEALRQSMFAFLRALGLSPIEWSKARAMTGKPNPFIGEILDVVFAKAAAVVVLFSPDDEARLAAEFLKPNDPTYEKQLTRQPRANVLWEAGMAYAHSADHTVLVQVGEVRPFSDIAGRHILHLSNMAESRREFVARLQSAGCDVDDAGTDWLNVGSFDATPTQPPALPGRKRL
ncbi:MAG TPA: TIR domain-containing protein [Lysobacter sp.]|nr:TIR domain-containing protein [Lysobacter sp.]